MYTTRVVLYLAILVVHLTPLTQASCGHTRGHQEVTRFGTRVSYCKYKGINMLPGSRLIDKDECHVATCGTGGLTICGYGINAGVYRGPPGCRVVSDGCEPRFIPSPGSRARCPR